MRQLPTGMAPNARSPDCWALSDHILAPMRSLRKLNAAAGTSYTRWEQVVANRPKSIRLHVSVPEVFGGFTIRFHERP